MATIANLKTRLQTLRRRIETLAPQRIAAGMERQTRENFRKQAYLNDKQPEPWKERFGMAYLRGGRVFGNVEPYLRYPKLRYTGTLYHSIGSRANRRQVVLYSTAPYARMHNEGTGGPGGNAVRMRPKASTVVVMKKNPVKRQFMGVGRKTYEMAWEVYEKMFRMFVS